MANRRVCELKVLGRDHASIAREVGCSQRTVEEVMKSNIGRAYMRELEAERREKLFSDADMIGKGAAAGLAWMVAVASGAELASDTTRVTVCKTLIDLNEKKHKGGRGALMNQDNREKLSKITEETTRPILDRSKDADGVVDYEKAFGELLAEIGESNNAASDAPGDDGVPGQDNETDLDGRSSEPVE